jgi:hypothetical protein
MYSEYCIDSRVLRQTPVLEGEWWWERRGPPNGLQVVLLEEIWAEDFLAEA